MEPLNLSRTKAALAYYDSQIPRLNRSMLRAETKEEVYRVQAEEDRLVAAVRTAFYEDTSDRNNYSQCAAVTIGFVRELLNKYPPGV